MHIGHKKCKYYLDKVEGTIIYTSLRYRDDYNRKALGLLASEGYYKKIGRFAYQRTNKQIDI